MVFFFISEDETLSKYIEYILYFDIVGPILFVVGLSVSCQIPEVTLIN